MFATKNVPKILEVEVLASCTFVGLMHQDPVSLNDVSLPDDAPNSERVTTKNEIEDFDYATSIFNLIPSHDSDESLSRHNFLHDDKGVPTNLSLFDGEYHVIYKAISIKIGLQVVRTQC